VVGDRDCLYLPPLLRYEKETSNFVSRLIVASPSSRMTKITLLFETSVSIRHGGSPPRRCAGAVIRGAVNKIGGSGRWLITVTVQLTSTSLIVRKSVEDMHGISCAVVALIATMRVQKYADRRVKRDSC